MIIINNTEHLGSIFWVKFIAVNHHNKCRM